MKKLIIAAVGLLMFSLAATATAQELRVQSRFSGLYIEDFCNPAECVGDLVSCPVGALLITSRGVLQGINGICDDLDPNVTDCGGRYTWFEEECLIPGSGSSAFAGSLRFFFQRGKGRYCFNDPAGTPADCQGTPPTGKVILTASIQSQGRINTKNFTAGYTGESSWTDVKTTPFFDPSVGKMMKLQEGAAVQYWTAQDDFTGPSCFVEFPNGCGWGGTTVSVAPPTPPNPP